MTGLEISLAPEELENQVEQLKLLRGTSFSHVALADSLWNDSYGGPSGADLLGFADEGEHGQSLPAELWSALKTEWYELACTSSSKYDGLRSKVASLKGSPATVIVSSIAAALAATLGLAAAVLVPFVAIFIHGSLTVGNNALCRAMSMRRNRDA